MEDGNESITYLPDSELHEDATNTTDSDTDTVSVSHVTQNRSQATTSSNTTYTHTDNSGNNGGTGSASDPDSNDNSPVSAHVIENNDSVEFKSHLLIEMNTRDDDVIVDDHDRTSVNITTSNNHDKLGNYCPIDSTNSTSSDGNTTVSHTQILHKKRSNLSRTSSHPLELNEYDDVLNQEVDEDSHKVIESDDQLTTVASDKASLDDANLAADCTLSDTGKYAFAGLAANILADFYKKPSEKKFRWKILEDLMVSVDLPESTRQAQHAVANGEYETEVDPLIDLLLDEQLVQKSPGALLSSLLLVAVKDGDYDARVRVIIEHMCWLLRVDIATVETVEEQLLAVLKHQAELSEEEKKKAAKTSRNTKIKRGILIGLATVVGGAVIGVTGGLAAPLIATGVGAIVGTAGAAALGSAAGVAIIGSLFGVAGAGLTGYKMKNRVGDIEQFEFDVLSEGSQMTLTIAVSGWVSDKGHEDFRTPWLTLDNSKEQYYLKYEGKFLQQLGQSLNRLYNLMVHQAITETLKYTALNTLLSAIAWPSALLGLANVIDNPWHVATQRAENSGKHLAEVLVKRHHGHRPVTLIGFSLGARVIFFCLKELAKHPRGAGIVENAYLLGAPVSGSPKEWEPFGNVVAGRIVNAYNRSDWMLKFLYRTASVQVRIAGTAPILWDDRRMINMDLTNIVSGHMDYMKKMTIVLDAVGVKTKEVKNVFLPHSDSGYSSIHSQLGEISSNTERSPLISKEPSSEDIPAGITSKTEGGQDTLEEGLDPSDSLSRRINYQKLSGTDSNLELSSPGLNKSCGEITDSDKSLPAKLNYDELVSQDSSLDSMKLADNQDVKPKHKVISKDTSDIKPAPSEKLLGDVSTTEVLVASRSDIGGELVADNPGDNGNAENVEQEIS